MQANVGTTIYRYRARLQDSSIERRKVRLKIKPRTAVPLQDTGVELPHPRIIV
jgi:hypothetical protein